jgi:hypothetical protein
MFAVTDSTEKRNKPTIGAILLEVVPNDLFASDRRPISPLSARPGAFTRSRA